MLNWVAAFRDDPGFFQRGRSPPLAGVILVIVLILRRSLSPHQTQFAIQPWLTTSNAASDTTNIDFEIQMMPADGIAAALSRKLRHVPLAATQ